MRLEKLETKFSVCKVASVNDINLDGMTFIAKTDKEISLVCATEKVPPRVTAREDGWNGLRIAGTLDFSLVGVLSDLATVLARNGISICAISTFDTDYIFVKSDRFEDACRVLVAAGYTFD